MGIFSSALGLMLFYMCLNRLGTITTNAQSYLRIPIGVALSVLLLGETVPSNLALGLVLVMAGVAAMTIPGEQYGRWLKRLRTRLTITPRPSPDARRGPANSPRPSVQPMMSSTWFSGCGIMPSTLPRSLTMPAIECAAPLKLEGSSTDALRRAVAIEHAPLAFEPLQRLLIRLVIALAMRDRHADHLAGIVAAGERRIRTLDPHMHVAADEFQPRIAHEHAGQKLGLAEDLEAVADAEHEPAVAREGAHRVHDRRARRDRAAAQIIAIGEAAGHHDEIGSLRQRGLGMPDHRRLVARGELQRARHVALAIDAGKDEDGGFHL